MKKSQINPKKPKQFPKQLRVLFFIVMLAILATACYTTTKCPAYGHYSQAQNINY